MSLDQLPDDLLGLALVVLLLGIRHGFDPDHLAAIDGLTRYNSGERPNLAKLAGFLFSLGHGLVIVPVSIYAASLAQTFEIPAWFDAFGTWVSITILLGLAVLNLLSVLDTPAHQTVQLKGWRQSFFARLLNVRHAGAMLAVGATFALSFDTLSQASLFALLASKYQVWHVAAFLSLLFVAGMLITDGINGLFIAKLIKRSDHTARVASRVMALAVSGVSILVAMVGILSELSPSFDGWRTGKEVWLGVFIVAILLASYFVGQRLSRPYLAKQN
jgi:high-affinity nickel-transport protein